MVFTKRLREGVRRGRIRCTIRIWQRLQVKVGGRYPLDDGHIVIDSIEEIEERDITDALAVESGFRDRADLMGVAKHGAGTNVYLIRFHYLAPGAWDVQTANDPGAVSAKKTPRSGAAHDTADVLRRIRTATPPRETARKKSATSATKRKKP
ncbi:MAG: hypothetical protein U0Q11_03535 [Vicinamibacterales bacterium]